MQQVDGRPAQDGGRNRIAHGEGIGCQGECDFDDEIHCGRGQTAFCATGDRENERMLSSPDGVGGSSWKVRWTNFLVAWAMPAGSMARSARAT